SDDSRIVVYYGQDWISPTTRVIFTLDYAGLGKVSSLLDGGMEAWVRDGHAVTEAVAAPKTGKLSALTLRPLVVDAKYVFEHLKTPHVAIVDGRSASFYDGVDTGQSHDQVHRTGHIAGAHNVPFDSIVDEHSMLRSPEELAALFTKAGVQPDDTVIGYCHLGQQATAMLFAARSLGHPVMLYDGSFEDWSRHADYPVDNPAAKDVKQGQ
ncbi:MAG: rhodanese-like domain-containing protein, partial [Acidobacteriota bacterium]